MQPQKQAFQDSWKKPVLNRGFGESVSAETATPAESGGEASPRMDERATSLAEWDARYEGSPDSKTAIVSVASQAAGQRLASECLGMAPKGNECHLIQESSVLPHSREQASLLAPPEAEGKCDDDGVVMEGPLQQHKFWSIWRTRWCVLNHSELRVYRSEDARRRHPEHPRYRFRVASLEAEIVPGAPQVLVCHDITSDGGPVAVFRAGRGQRWEEIASARLWLAGVAAVM